MKKAILRAVVSFCDNPVMRGILASVIMLSILWVGCEDASGKMTWGFVFSKIAALALIGVCGFILSKVYEGSK